VAVGVRARIAALTSTAVGVGCAGVGTGRLPVRAAKKAL